MIKSNRARRQSRASASTFAHTLCCMLFGSLVIACTPSTEPSEQPSKTLRTTTSIVLIVVDTLRADHIGGYGYPRDTTPHLDDWLHTGRLYEHAVAPSNWTLPSVASLLTGLRPSDHRAGTVPLVDGKKPQHVSDFNSMRPLAPGVATLAEAMQRSGRATGAIVTNSFLGRNFGIARGFDSWGHQNAWAATGRRAGKGVDLALEWIEARGTTPYFMLLHVFDPHLGYDAPAPQKGRFTAPFEGGRYRLPFIGDSDFSHGVVNKPVEDRDQQFVNAAYDEEILYVDRELERLRAGLEKTGALKDTLVVLTSDHGEELFEHGGFEHGHALWREVLDVPLVVWGPGIEPGREGQWVSLLDIAPTLLEAIGENPLMEMPGRSLWSNLTQGTQLASAPIEADGDLYGPRQRMLIAWPYKIILSEELRRIELYNIENDPNEMRDLSDEQPDRVSELRTALGVSADRNGHGADVPGNISHSQETLDSLRSLGYIDDSAVPPE